MLPNDIFVHLFGFFIAHSAAMHLPLPAGRLKKEPQSDQKYLFGFSTKHYGIKSIEDGKLS